MTKGEALDLACSIIQQRGQRVSLRARRLASHYGDAVLNLQRFPSAEHRAREERLRGELDQLVTNQGSGGDR